MQLSSQEKKIIPFEDAPDQLAHSMSSMDYLKIDEYKNFIFFEFASETKTISIMQQFTKNGDSTGEETNFESIYKIKIYKPTLRELLIFNSFYVCPT